MELTTERKHWRYCNTDYKTWKRYMKHVDGKMWKYKAAERSDTLRLPGMFY